MAKDIIADATVEAEYGDNLVEGTTSTLAHHGSRSHNPSPCNTPDVPVLNDDATILVSHIDLDTLGGIYALQGRKPEDIEFWKAAEKIDVEGTHHMYEVSPDIQDKLNAYYSFNDAQPRERYSEVVDVTKQVDDTFDTIQAITDKTHPEHDKLIADGKEWREKVDKAVENCLVYEDEHVRVFHSDGTFCAASYYSPNQNAIIPATITYNDKFKSITLAFEDGGKEFNAREIVQSLWGEEAGGREGIAGSPRNQEMTKDDLSALSSFVMDKYQLEEMIKTEESLENFEKDNGLGLPKGIENCKAGVYTIENGSPLKFNESMSISNFFFENSIDDICNNKENVCVFTDKSIYDYQFQISFDDYCNRDNLISDKENEHRYNFLYMPNIEEIGYAAFDNQTQLTDVYIGNNDITINNHAFDSCVSLERIHLSERLKEIPANCFTCCLSLSNIDIPDSVTKIGRAAFF